MLIDRTGRIELSEETKAIIKRENKRHKKLYPLRITDKIVIQVPKRKLNEKYRQEYMNRIGLVVPVDSKRPRFSIKEQEVVDLINQGYNRRDTSVQAGVSLTFVTDVKKKMKLLTEKDKDYQSCYQLTK